MSEDIVATICSFLTFAGIAFKFAPLPGGTFLPGLLLQDGCLLIDREKLLYPGDILHEAGHLATAAPSVRATMGGNLENNNLNQGGEIMAIAWSYAACVHLGIDPKIVFHANGYKNGSDNLVNLFNNGATFGQPLLQWAGMTYCTHEQAAKFNTKPFPHMITWLRVADIDGAYADE